MTGPVVWVARNTDPRSAACVFQRKPEPAPVSRGNVGHRWVGWPLLAMPFDLFPDLKPGECRRYRLVPEEDN